MSPNNHTPHLSLQTPCLRVIVPAHASLLFLTHAPLTDRQHLQHPTPYTSFVLPVEPRHCQHLAATLYGMPASATRTHNAPLCCGRATRATAGCASCVPRRPPSNRRGAMRGGRHLSIVESAIAARHRANHNRTPCVDACPTVGPHHATPTPQSPPTTYHINTTQ